MNRETLERWVLLKQSGELGRWRAWRLSRYLARDPALQAFAQDVGDLSLLSRSRSAGAPPEHLVEAIQARLKETPDRRELIVLEPTSNWSWRPAYAVAAGLVLLLAAGAILLRPGADPSPPASAIASLEPDRLAWEDSLDSALDEVESWMAGSAAEIAAAQVSANGASEEEQLVRELLQWEGISI